MPKERSMTEGVIWKQLFLFTLPIMAGNLLQQLYNTVDSIIVGNFVSEDALAAVGTCSPMTMLFIAIALGMSTGCSVGIAQYFGAKRDQDLREAVSTSMILLVILGGVFTVVCGVFARPLLQYVLTVPEYQLGMATVYLRIYAIGLLFQFIYNIVAAILRALGDSKATLYFLLISSLLNIALDLLFVLGLHWGVAGVAIATVLSQLVSAAVSLAYMFRTYAILRFGKGEFRFHREKGSIAVQLGVPNALQQCVVSCGQIVIMRLVNHYAMAAAYTAAIRVENFAMIPVFGFTAGMATFTGQNIGAKKLKRIEQGWKINEGMAMAVTAVLAAVVYVAGGALLQLFGLTAESMQNGLHYLRFVAPCLLIFCFYIQINGVLQGAGDMMFTAFNSMSGLAIRCVAAYVMAYFTPISYAAIWISVPISWGYSLILAFVRYRMGKWKEKGIVKRT